MADDDKDDFIILQQAAEKARTKINITYAANWIDLWRQLLKTLPDVIFLDLNMPVKDGFDCLYSLRQETRFQKLPIVIYSTSTNRTDIDKAYIAGANYFIIKPNTLEEITHLLDRISSMNKQQLISIPAREEFIIL